MAMPNPTDEVAVLYSDLEMFASALANAEGLATAIDLQYKFQNLARQQRQGALSKQLQDAVARVEGYIATANEE
jgi:hypothetical protein